MQDEHDRLKQTLAKPQKAGKGRAAQPEAASAPGQDPAIFKVPFSLFVHMPRFC